MDTIDINKRYSDLAEGTCCLSCGGAINYSSPQPGEICIDLGSGRGTDAIRLAEMVEETGFVYGIDISDGMIEKANKNKKKLGISNIRFMKSELETLKLSSEIAHLIISNCTINHASDKMAVWSEIYRVLKPGGRFVVSDIYALETVPDEFRNDPVAISECWAGAVTKSEYLQTIAKSGLRVSKISEESTPYDKGKIKVASFTLTGIRPK